MTNRKSFFWSSFKRETGKNSGKWLSNKIFGNGWATPYKNEISVTETEQFNGDSTNNANNGVSSNIDIKNVASNEHDVDIAKIKSKATSDFFDKTSKNDNKTFKKTVILTVGIIATMLLFVFIMNRVTTQNRLSDNELHLQLEKKELLILQLLNEGDKNKALELVFELNHNSTKIMPGTGGISDILNQQTYENYWQIKRDDLKNKILQLK